MVPALIKRDADALLPFQDFNARALAWAKQNLGKPGRRVKPNFVGKIFKPGLSGASYSMLLVKR